MDMWLKIGSAILIVMMVAFLWPSAKHMMENSRKAEPGEWQGMLMPIVLVLLFVAFLMWLV